MREKVVHRRLTDCFSGITNRGIPFHQELIKATEDVVVSHYAIQLPPVHTLSWYIVDD